jgi:hypothetical protein
LRPGCPLFATWVVGWIWDPTIALTFVFPLLSARDIVAPGAAAIDLGLRVARAVTS